MPKQVLSFTLNGEETELLVQPYHTLLETLRMNAGLTGVFAAKAWGAPTDGLLAGDAGLMWPQTLGVIAAAAYSAVMTFIILRVIALVVPLRREPGRERIGLDVIQHGEEAYSHGEGALLVAQDRRAKARSEVNS